MTKFDPHLFFNPPLKKLSTPPLLSTPHLQKISIPTSILRIDHCLQFLQMSKILYIITNKLLNYNKCSSETAQNKLNLYKNSFCFRGLRPLSPHQGSAPEPRWGRCPQTPIYPCAIALAIGV